MKVETVKIKNINGKDVLYVQISNGFETVNINIGERNFELINNLINKENNITNVQDDL